MTGFQAITWTRPILSTEKPLSRWILPQMNGKNWKKTSGWNR
jgi:hypothetical protein